MESSQFDSLVRALGEGGSRRAMTRAGLGMLGAAALAAVGLGALVDPTVTANTGKKGKGKGGGKSKGKGGGKSKGKGKKKGGCAEQYQVAGQAGCPTHPDLGKCATEEEHQAGHELAAQCRTTYGGYCDLIPEANECKSYFFSCCKYRETCEQEILIECIKFGFSTVYPELCTYIRFPDACP